MATTPKAVVTANTAAKVSTALTPAVCFALVIQSADKARNSALFFIYSVTAFMLNVVHLHDAGADGYMNKADAQKYIKDELAKQANVKGGMLDHYVRTGGAIYDALIGAGAKPTSLGAPIVKMMADAKNDEKNLSAIVGEIGALVEKNTGARSFRDLSVALGFKSFAAKANAGPNINTTAKAADRITGALTAVTNAMAKHQIKGASPAKVNEAVSSAVANAVSDPLATARECLNRVAKSETVDVKQIETFIEFCEGIVKQLEARAKAQRQAAASKDKAPKGVVIAAAQSRKGRVMQAGRSKH